MDVISQWKYEPISGNFYPRQLEFHPNGRDIIFGTICGELCKVNLETKDIEVVNHLGTDKSDTILALSWLKAKPGLFLSGSSTGKVCCADIERKNEIIHVYPNFDRLTSVHSNCNNSVLLLSGYAENVSLYDIETSAHIRTYKGIHSDHINISRFTNNSPHIFGTSSFDGTIKLWDLRQKNIDVTNEIQDDRNNLGQIYTIQCQSGVVMINFSLDDTFILASAQDNEICQYIALDGRKHSQYRLSNTGLKGNFTRAYYTASGKYTITGACEQNNVKLLCSYTGDYLSSISLTPIMKDPSIYVQSLRGSPNDDFCYCVMTSYKDIPLRELVLLTAETREEPLDFFMKSRDDIPNDHMENNLLQDTVKTSYVSLPSDQYLSDMFELRGAAASATFNKHNAFYQLGDPSRGLIWLVYDYSDVSGKYLAVHGFVLKARLPSLLMKANRIISSNAAILETKQILSLEEWKGVSLLIDYLYTDLQALEIHAFRRTVLGCLSSVALQNIASIYHSPVKELIDNASAMDVDAMQEDLSYASYEVKNRELLLRDLAFDNSLWSLSTLVSDDLLQLLFSFRNLGRLLSIKEVSQHVEWLLYSLLGPKSAYKIWQWSIEHNCTLLAEESCSYLSRRLDVIQLNNGLVLKDALSTSEYRLMSQVVYKAQTDMTVSVMSKDDFAGHLDMVNEWLEENVVNDNHKDHKYIKQVRSSWLDEETPFVRSIGPFPPFTRLPVVYYHQACIMQDSVILYLGGMNRDRLIEMTRMLVFDIYEDRFRYVEGRGKEIPASAYMHVVVPLQKHSTRHLALFGAKVKRCEVAKASVPNKRNVIWEALPLIDEKATDSKPIAHVVDSTAGQQPLRDSIFEFDYLNLTWLHKPVKIDVASEVSRFAQVDDRNTSIIDASNALNSRIAQSAAVCYSEDVPYRCSRCLFTRDNDFVVKLRCDHCNAVPATYCIQFSGYCGVKERTVNDLYVLKCFPAAVGYSYEWVKVKATGDTPSGRFSHAAAFIPKGKNIYSRMFVHSGVLNQMLNDELQVASLRINTANDAFDATWESISQFGEVPPPLHGHQMTHVAPDNTCLVMCGNAVMRQRECTIGTIWCMHFREVQEGGSNVRLRITWSTLKIHGPELKARSRFTSAFHMIKTEGEERPMLFIFGGMDELPQDTSAIPAARNRKDCDAIMHRLAYKENDESSWLESEFPSDILWRASEPRIMSAMGTIGQDMLKLIKLDHAGEKEDSNHPYIVLPDMTLQLNLDDAVVTQQLKVFATLVAKRCPIIQALFSTGMQEAQTGVMKISEGPSTNAYVRLMQYMAADFTRLETIQDAVQMLELGNMYSLQDLIKLCEGSLLRLVNSDTVLELLCYAENYNLELLKSTCYSFLLRGDQATLKRVLEGEDVAEEQAMEISVDAGERNGMESNETVRGSDIPADIRKAFASFARDHVHIYRNNIPSASDAL